MAGIGFELKRLFQKKGITNQIRAYTYSSLVTVGPMIFCMCMLLGVQNMMADTRISYSMQQLFLAGIIYSFIFSYLLANIFNLQLTRKIADKIFMNQVHEIYSLLRHVLHILLPIAALFALLFLVPAKLEITVKIVFYLFYMELLLIWTLSAYISAVKEYKIVTYAFLVGICSALGGCYLLIYFTSYHHITYIVLILDIGLMITVSMIWLHIKKLFYIHIDSNRKNQTQHLVQRSYPSLIGIGFLNALGLFSHQFIQWFGPNGIWIEGSFLMAPRYDVAVYYAFLSIIPTLVMFVVNLETEFYQTFRKYYELVLGRGNMNDIDRAHSDMNKTLFRELAFIMGIQLFFSILFITLGIRFLPMLGFTIEQIDTFNILVMGFYVFITYTMISVILLYFDDRVGCLWLSILFLVLCTTTTLSFLLLGSQGYSLFISSFITLIVAFARLRHILRNLHYYTYSAQPVMSHNAPHS